MWVLYTFDVILHETERKHTGKNFRQKGRQSMNGGGSA